MTAAGRTALLLATASLTAGCGIFGGGEDGELEPKELVAFEETLELERLWRRRVGRGSENLRLGLEPAGDGIRVYAASRDGRVVAYHPESGERRWQAETGVLLSAGPGIGEGIVVVAGSDGDIIGLSAEDGRERWRRKVGGEVLATPVVEDDALIIQTIDGTLHVLSTFEGSERWSLEQSLPPLTLRGAAAPVVVGTTVIAGFDNGRVVAANLIDGVTEWEITLSPPSGRSDLERLADIDGSIVAVEQDVYASAYHGRVAALAAESGQVLWSREISTYAGVTADWSHLYTTGEHGEVIALSRRNGSEVWRNDSLLRRQPTVPVPFATTVVVGDFEGYVHFFSNLDGRPVARVRVGSGMISGAPAVIGGRLYVQNESGQLAAYAVPERSADGADGDG